MKKPRLLTKIPRNPDDTEKNPDLLERQSSTSPLHAKQHITSSVATGLFKFSPNFVSKKTQKNPGIENYIQSSKIKGYKPTTSVDMARC